MLTLIENSNIADKNLIVDILSVTADLPDTDGQICPTINFKVTNKSSVAYDFVDIDALIINGLGQVVHHYKDNYSGGPINPGDSEEMEIGGFNLFTPMFDVSLETVKVLIKATASRAVRERIEMVAAPNEIFKIVPVPSTTFLDVMQVSGGIWVEEIPSWFKGCRIQLKFVVQNKTSLNLQRFEYQCKIVDKSGKTVDSCDGYNDVAADAIASVEGYMELKDRKKLTGASLSVDLSLLVPVAEGTASYEGLSVQ